MGMFSDCLAQLLISTSRPPDTESSHVWHHAGSVLIGSAGLKQSGLAGVWWQAVALLVAVLPVWLTQLGAQIPESSTTHVLLGGLVASRFGLWLFDLAVSQMLQEWVADEELGKLPTAAHYKTLLCANPPKPMKGSIFCNWPRTYMVQLTV